MREISWLLIIVAFMIDYNFNEFQSLSPFILMNNFDKQIISKIMVKGVKSKRKAKEMASTIANIESTDLRRRNFLPSRDIITSTVIASPINPCDEKNAPNYMIYCQGELLHTVLLSNIFNDSKTFVDKPIKKEPDEIISTFNQKFSNQITINDREALISFVDEYFDTEGSDIQECPEDTMKDWNGEPEYLIAIEDRELSICFGNSCTMEKIMLYR
ncbi:Trehalase family protein [Brugia pahangi]